MTLADISKMARVSALLGIGGAVVHADTRSPEVAIYSTARGPDTQLIFSRDAHPPIPDLDLDEVRITGTLVFGGAYHRVVLPWRYIFAAHLPTRNVTDGLFVWADSVPGDHEPAIVELLKRAGLWHPERPS